jgi:hypothetical protein
MSITIPAEFHELAAVRSTSLCWYYQAGRLLLSITPSRRATAGAAMRQIADEVFRDRKIVPTLYACRRFARVCSEREVAALHGLSWKHVMYLISVRSLRLRRQLVRRTRSERLSARELALAVQEQLGKRTNGGRRPQSRLLSPKAGCRESARLCNDVTRNLPTWLRDLRRSLDRNDREQQGLIATTRESLNNALRAIQYGLRRLPDLTD